MASRRDVADAAYWLDAPETPTEVTEEIEQGEQAQADDFRRMRLAVARHDALTARSTRTPHEKAARRPAPRSARPRRRNTRTGPRRARAPASSGDDPDSDPEPERRHSFDLGWLDVASARMWTRVRRREARRRLAAA